MSGSAFNNAVTAMVAMSSGLGTISQNIANLNTTAYKRVETHFKTVLSETNAVPAGPSTGLAGFAVAPANRYRISEQGTITPTNQWSDLAINGRGFFAVGNSRSSGADLDNPSEVFYTRDGGFSQVAAPEGKSYFVTAGGLYLLGWQTEADGSLPEGGALSPVYTLSNTMMPGLASSKASVAANLPADGSAPETISIPVYDSSFAARTVTMNLTPATANTWDVTFATQGGSVTPATPVALTFSGAGGLVGPVGMQPVSFDWGGGASATVNFDFSALTQFAGEFTVNQVEQNGYPNGLLNKAEFSGQGELLGSFDNGQQRPLFKVPLATFVADDRLEPVSGNLFRRTSEAGEVTVKGIGDNEASGALVPGALESSNTVIEDEFTRMIVTQRAYSSNATVLRTADEMTVTARDLKR